MNFYYTVNPDTDEPIVLVNKHIGYDPEDGLGIMGDQFQAELLALDGMGKKSIKVWINSPGGDVAQGFSMCDAILKTKTPVDTYCGGIAASMAGVLFQTGRKRIMADYGILMYHNPFSSQAGNKQIEAYRQSLITLVASKSGKSEEEISKIMNRESWISADEAFDMKLCDEVEVSADFNKKHWKQVGNQSDLKANWNAANKVFNSIFIKTKNMSLPKVANKLGLIAEANEDSIIAAIDKVQNSHTQAQARIQELEKEKTEAEKKLADVNNKIKTLEDEKTKAENDKKVAEEAAKETAAVALIDNFAKAGKIKNDAGTKALWVKKAKEDHDGTKALIEGLPVNAKAAKIENAAGGDASARPKGNFAARAMAKVQDNLKK